jgi:hypothetical protein
VAEDLVEHGATLWLARERAWRATATTVPRELAVPDPFASAAHDEARRAWDAWVAGVAPEAKRRAIARGLHLLQREPPP